MSPSCSLNTQPAEDLHRRHRHRDRDDLPRLPVRHGPAAASPHLGLAGCRAGRGPVLDGRRRHHRERARRRLRRVHGHQHRLAPQPDLRRRQLHVGRAHLHRGRDRHRRHLVRRARQAPHGRARLACGRTRRDRAAARQGAGVRRPLATCGARPPAAPPPASRQRPAASARSSSERSPVGASPEPQNGTCSRTSAYTRPVPAPRSAERFLRSTACAAQTSSTAAM